MLKGISPYLAPDLLKAMCEMGHGDELLLADAHFPGHAIGRRIQRADGLNVTTILEAILPLFALDEEPLTLMEPDAGDSMDLDLEAYVLHAIQRYSPNVSTPLRLARKQFYERAASCYVIVITSELRTYGNLIIRKGITPL